MLARTPFLCSYMRLLGATIGNGVYIDGMNIGDGVSMHEPDLVKVGDGTIFNNQATVLTNTIQDGFLTLGGVSVGSYCQVCAKLKEFSSLSRLLCTQAGCRSLIMHGATLGDRVTLCEHSVLQTDQVS